MSYSAEPENTSNPFTSGSQMPREPSTITLRPTGVTVVGVLCILGGIMGALAGLVQLGQQFFQNLATSFLPAGEAGDAQREWFAEMQEVNSKFLIPNLTLGVIAIALGACLVIGGVGVLQPKKWSRTWLRRTFLAAIVFEVLRMILYAVWQFSLFPIMQRQFEVMAPGAQPGNPAVNSETFQTMQLAMMLIGLVFAFLWFLTKLVAYFWGRRYLNRDPAKAYCAKHV